MLNNYLSTLSLSNLLANGSKQLVAVKHAFLSDEVHIKLELLLSVSDTLLRLCKNDSECEKIIQWYEATTAKLVADYETECSKLPKSYAAIINNLVEQIKKELENVV